MPPPFGPDSGPRLAVAPAYRCHVLVYRTTGTSATLRAIRSMGGTARTRVDDHPDSPRRTVVRPRTAAGPGDLYQTAHA